MGSLPILISLIVHAVLKIAVHFLPFFTTTDDLLAETYGIVALVLNHAPFQSLSRIYDITPSNVADIDRELLLSWIVTLELDGQPHAHGHNVAIAALTLLGLGKISLGSPGGIKAVVKGVWNPKHREDASNLEF